MGSSRKPLDWHGLPVGCHGLASQVDALTKTWCQRMTQTQLNQGWAWNNWLRTNNFSFLTWVTYTTADDKPNTSNHNEHQATAKQPKTNRPKPKNNKTKTKQKQKTKKKQKRAKAPIHKYHQYFRSNKRYHLWWRLVASEDVFWDKSATLLLNPAFCLLNPSLWLLNPGCWIRLVVEQGSLYYQPKLHAGFFRGIPQIYPWSFELFVKFPPFQQVIFSWSLLNPDLFWVFPKIGVPQNGWFIMENPIKMDDLGGFNPLFSETSFYSLTNQDTKFMAHRTWTW